MGQSRFDRTLLITGGAGFIGSHLVRHLVRSYPNYLIVNLDALTYAGNLENLSEIEQLPNYVFEKGDITDETLLEEVFTKYRIDGVIHLAAESHVDRSIKSPIEFVRTNVEGTVNLLNMCRDHWGEDKEGKRFHHISTDEVYGSLEEGFFAESSPYQPNSPYAASKAASDHFVRAYGVTYGLPVLISNCSNNYGPLQFPEKFIPLMINNIINEKPLPVYGDGKNVRDWLYVEDHVLAIDSIFHRGRIGQTYCVGGENEWKNIDVVHALCELMDQKLGRTKGTSEALISFVKDRPGHDLRYAINATKIEKELGWRPKTGMKEGLNKTIDWYISNREWLQRVTSGAYRNYYREMYLEQDKPLS